MVWLLTGLLVLYIVYCLAFIFFQYEFIFRPKKLNHDFRFLPSQPFEELNLETTDGENLNALYLLPNSAKGIVIYLHGNWENLSNYLPYTKKFTDHGYGVLIVDYRGYGKSTGRLTEEHFFHDTEYWYQWVEKKFTPEQIIIYGRSLGTAAAAWLAANKAGKHLILETPYCSMYDLARRYFMLIPDGNYLKFGFRTDVNLERVKIPVTILHGTRDETVSIHSARKLKKYLKPGDQFIEIKGGKHRTLERFEQYHAVMDQLLKDERNGFGKSGIT